MNRWLAGGLAVAGIWLCTAAMAAWSPQMVTGSAHEQLPIVAITAPVWALLATGLVFMGSGVGSGDRWLVWGTYAGGVAALWGAAAIVSIVATPMVTGTDPTTIPIAGLVAPILALVATAYATVAVVGIDSRQESVGTMIDDAISRWTNALEAPRPTR